MKRYSLEHKRYFFQVLSEYKTALKTQQNTVLASLRVAVALNTVPKSYKRLVSRAYKDANPKK